MREEIKKSENEEIRMDIRKAGKKKNHRCSCLEGDADPLGPED
jgi:hypothetical protein